MNRIEWAVHRALERSLRIKKLVVVSYQTACALLPYRELIPSAVRHERHFFGFHDKCPWHYSGSMALAHRFEDEMQPGRDAVEVGLLDPKIPGSFVPLGRTEVWNWQQGAELQWLGNSDYFIYNLLWGERPASAISEINGQIVSFHAPVSAVSSDGRQAASLDFGRLAVGMPGYGYPYVGPPPSRGAELRLLDLESGREKIIFAVAGDHEGTPFLSHTSFSPSGGRLAFFERTSTRGGALSTTVRVVDIATDSIQKLMLHDASHYAWIDDEHLIAYCRDSRGGPWAYHVLNLEKQSVLSITWLAGLSDGHPGTCAAHGLVVSDTYPDRQRLQRLLVLDPSTESAHEIARLRIPRRFRGVRRCDFHPRWSRDGSEICFDSAHTGVRSLYFMDCPVPPSLARVMDNPIED
jgi:hypothetical protein